MPAEIVETLQKVEEQLGSGATVAEVCRELKISEQTYYRWRATYSGVNPEELARNSERLRRLENENQQMREAIVDLVLQVQLQKHGNGNNSHH